MFVIYSLESELRCAQMTFLESVLICIGKVDKYELGEADYEYFKDGAIDVCNLPIRE